MGILNQGVKKPAYNTTTTFGVIPAAITGTGTLDSSGVRITGTGTSFTTEAVNGDYLYAAPAAVEARRIKHVLSDTLIELTEAFTVPLVAAVVGIIKKTDISNVLQVGIANTGLVAGVLDEDTLPPGVSDNWGDSGGVGPITFNATGTTFGISLKTRA